MATKDTGKVDIHGRTYETVASRVQKFREKYSNQFAISTEIVSADEERVVMKASILGIAGTDGPPFEAPLLIATGHAEERRDASTINRTSALENCETSAIGRALAAFGLAGTEFASADEVAQAITQQATKPAVGTAPHRPAPMASESFHQDPKELYVTEAQGKLLMARSRDASGLGDDWNAVRDWFSEQFGMSVNEVKKAEFPTIAEELTRLIQEAGR